MPIDAPLLERNLELVSEHELRLSELVYDALFEAHPEILELFTARNSAASQQMVHETLMYAMDHLHGANWVEANLASLGEKHAGYEVTEEMYGWYSDALLAALAEVSGDAWSDALASSWRQMLGYLGDLMIAELE